MRARESEGAGESAEDAAAADRGRGGEVEPARRGGAGFPTGMKWNFVRKETSFPKILVVNADEANRGRSRTARSCCAARTCSSRPDHRLLRDRVPPHLRLLPRRVPRERDGAAGEGDRGRPGRRVHREEHPRLRARCGSARRLTAPARTSAGEETALLESLEGRKGYPRLKRRSRPTRAADSSSSPPR